MEELPLEKKELLKCFQACMLLHAVGDTIGYRNGQYKFNFGHPFHIILSNMKIFNFIRLGGVNEISLRKWLVSDNTIMHIATAKSLLNNDKSYKKFSENYVKVIDDITKRNPDIENQLRRISQPDIGSLCRSLRCPEIANLNELKAIVKGREFDKQDYDIMNGGYGASIRSPVIGLVFHGEENREKLIATSIEVARITHNSVIGYIGALGTALFIAFALEKVPIENWMFKFLELINTGMIEKYLKATYGLKEYLRDKDIVTDRINKYIARRFKNKEVIMKFSHEIPEQRTQMFVELFDVNEKQPLGWSSIDVLIMAYDAVLDASNKVAWEKVIFYAMLQAGNGNSVGSIAGALYGALYEFNGVPKKNLKHIEYKKELLDLGEALFKKYFM